jgi:hypothetical protein
MGPGYVQGLSRAPPDHPEGGAGGELYSGGLWSTRNIEPRTPNLESDYVLNERRMRENHA